MTKFQRKSKEERCEEIREGAKKIFLEKGYRNTTMEDIISQTTLSKGGVYQYYSSPKAILMDLMRYGNESSFIKIRDLEQTINDDTPIEDVLVLLSMNKLFTKNPEKRLYAMFLSEMIYDKEIEALYYEIEAEIKLRVYQLIHKRMPNLKDVFNYDDYLLSSRVLSAFILGDELFSREKIFNKNQESVASMLRVLYQKK